MILRFRRVANEIRISRDPPTVESPLSQRTRMPWLQKVVLGRFKRQRIGVPPIAVFDAVFPSNSGSDQDFTRS